ncbi:hypothetical protein JTB14_028438 [Gonioctena quinquepunctata]|nr:hypothetical protein JTB14_028438 [Gonioctena quinquepunctata]
MEADIKYTYSKMMGEGSDVDDSDDEEDFDALIDKMSENQKLYDTDPSITVDPSVMSENAINLIRTIEERMGSGTVLPETQSEMFSPTFSEAQFSNNDSRSVHNHFPRSSKATENIEMDPNTMSAYSVELVKNIERGLNYLYDKGVEETGRATNKLLPSQNIIDQVDLFNIKYQGRNVVPELQINNHSHWGLGYKVNEKAVLREQGSQRNELEEGIEWNMKKFVRGELLQQSNTPKPQNYFEKLAQNLEAKQLLNRSSHNLTAKMINEDRYLFAKDRMDDLLTLKNKKAVCQHCKETFPNLENLLYHLRAEHKKTNQRNEELEYRSEEKDKIVASRQSLSEKECCELKKCIKEPEQKTKTDQVFLQNNSSAMKTGVESSCKSIFILCQYCNETFTTAAHLELHLNGCHKKKTFMCQYCKKMFMEKECLRTHFALAQHAKAKHGNAKDIKDTTTKKLVNKASQKKNNCHICGKKFMTANDLTEHSEYLHGIEIKTFSPLGALRNHSSKAHLKWIKVKGSDYPRTFK